MSAAIVAFVGRFFDCFLNVVLGSVICLQYCSSSIRLLLRMCNNQMRERADQL